MVGVMKATALGLLSLVIALANALVFVRRVRAVAVPQDRIAHDLGWAAAFGLGVAALAGGAGWIGGIPATLGAALGGLVLLLRLGSAQARNAPAVRVGGPILDFTAPDENGAPFTLSSLAGKPFLLKFFRGHW
jgi:hypothetical protein